MKSYKNIVIPGVDGKPIALDIMYSDAVVSAPVVIYVHGFNGFKDWGNFDMVAKSFAAAGFVMVKFNFSHNGTMPATPEDFTDLEAFGQNNYTKQLHDLGLVVEWVCDTGNIHHSVMDTTQLCLIGHSMGGGIATLYAAKDSNIKKLITWAGISECKTPWGNWPQKKIQQWKEDGVAFYNNGRTNQQMPLYYQLYLNYQQHVDELDVKKAIAGLAIPVLICQGTLDAAVPLQKALDLQSWQPGAQLFTVESDHVFGRKHPWTSDHLPPAMQQVIVKSISFLKE